MEKILFIINSSEDGGAQKMISTLFENIKQTYPKSELIFLKCVESQYSEITGSRYINTSLESSIDYFILCCKLCKYIYHYKPDVIISFLPLSNIVSSFIGRIFGVKVRIVSQRNPSYSYGYFVRIFDRALGSMGFYTHNVANSLSVYESFSSYPVSYKKKLSIINNCVEKPDYIISSAEARNILGIPIDSKVLCNVGRLHEQKNQEVIIKAMKHIDSALLYIAGDGPLNTYLNKLIFDNGLESKVFLLGNLDRSKIRLLLRSADIFIMPSKYEGLSNALIEALSFGKPVICSSIPSFTNFFINSFDSTKYNAIIINDFDEKTWADNTVALINSQENLNHYSNLSYQLVSKLTPEKMSSAFLELI